MDRRAFQIVAVIAAVALVAVVGLTFAARGEGPEEGFLHHLHRLGQHFHGGGHHHGPMAELIEQLELTPEQTQHLEKIHEILEGAHGGGARGSMAELHERLVAQFEQGHVESTEIRIAIDEHVEQIREMAYATTDELVALINSLDAGQREIMLGHFEEMHGKHHVP